jgi:hypothetical protein
MVDAYFFLTVVMTQLSDEDQKHLSKFVELFLTLLLRGFDEMDMKYRLELVKSFGFVLDLGINRTLGRMNELEKRMDEFEERVAQKESVTKKK